MLLHFGGSRNGYKEHLSDYFAVRAAILNLGHTLARDWLEAEKTLGVVNLFTENEKSIAKSDGVILDGSYDTHGIGIQLALSLMFRRPVLLLIKAGSKNPVPDPTIINARDRNLLQTAEYTEADEIERLVSSFCEWVESNSQLARFNIELDRKLDNYLKLKANINRTSKAEEIRRLVEIDLMRNGEVRSE